MQEQNLLPFVQVLKLFENTLCDVRLLNCGLTVTRFSKPIILIYVAASSTCCVIKMLLFSEQFGLFSEQS